MVLGDVVLFMVGFDVCVLGFCLDLGFAGIFAYFCVGVILLVLCCCYCCFVLFLLLIFCFDLLCLV